MVGMNGCWAGVDVGAERKGFHVAVVDEDGLVAGPTQAATPAAVVAWLEPHRPHLVAVDSPRRPAPDGKRSRPDERDLARAVCGIRYTPDLVSLARSPRYYAWVRHGFALYDALARAGWEPIECFPTATWTRLGGPRQGVPRGLWSRAVLAAQGLGRLPLRMSQDARDATGAALTARLHAQGRTEAFGEIVVPRATC
jgi:predicted nuclease with RNAse H fold